MAFQAAIHMARENGADRLVPVPSPGRVFITTRRVRLSDVRSSGELRLDGIARYIQDVSNDDGRDAGLTDAAGWVVRRTVVEIRVPARYLEVLTLSTFCSGMGGRWAERRVSISGTEGASIEAATLWVHIDPTTGRPLVLPQQFHDLYDATVGGRRISASLLHDTRPPSGALTRPWVVRQTDLDTYDHVNNAASWEIVEEALATWPWLSNPLRAELEYRDPILPDHPLTLAVAGGTNLPADDGSGLAATAPQSQESVSLWVSDDVDSKTVLTGVVTPL